MAVAGGWWGCRLWWSETWLAGQSGCGRWVVGVWVVVFLGHAGVLMVGVLGLAGFGHGSGGLESAMLLLAGRL